MNIHSVEMFPRDVNCRKRHHSLDLILVFLAIKVSDTNLVTE